MSQESAPLDNLSLRRPVTVPEEDSTVLIDDESMTTAPSDPIHDVGASPTVTMAPISLRTKRASRSKPCASASPRTDNNSLLVSASLKGEDLSMAHSGYASIIVTPYPIPGVEEGGDDEVVVEAHRHENSVDETHATVNGVESPPISPPEQHFSLCSMIEYGVSSEQGTRKTMEDRHTARLTEKGKCHEEVEMDEDVTVEDTPEETLAQGVPFFGVYDGHGGTQCAAYLRKKLDKLVLGHPKIIDEPEVGLREAIDYAEREFLELFKEDSSGSTAAVAIIVGNKIVTANVGDTEIVLNRGGVAHCLSEKHNVKSSASERERVIEAGGRLYQNSRVAHPLYNPQVLSLGVSRAIGDSGFKLNEYTQGKPSGVIATASTRTTDFDYAQDEFLLIGCDGVWDVMTYQQAVDFCVEVQKKADPSLPSLTPQQISSALVTRALELGSNDNVTAMFISLRSRPRSANHRPPSAVHQRWGERTRAALQSVTDDELEGAVEGTGENILENNIDNTVNNTPEPAETTPEPADTTPEPADTTPEPADTTPEPAETTPEPAETIPEPAETTPEPAETSTAPET